MARRQPATAPATEPAPPTPADAQPPEPRKRGHSTRSRAQALVPRGNGHGRPSVLVDAVQQRLVDAISVGCSYASAAHYAGISERVVHKWIELAESDAMTPLAKRARLLYAEIKKAEAGTELESLSIILKAGATNWTARAWYLERKYPERFGRRDALAVQHQGDVQVTVRYIDERESPPEVIDVPVVQTYKRKGD